MTTDEFYDGRFDGIGVFLFFTFSSVFTIGFCLQGWISRFVVWLLGPHEPRLSRPLVL